MLYLLGTHPEAVWSAIKDLRLLVELYSHWNSTPEEATTMITVALTFP